MVLFIVFGVMVLVIAYVHFIQGLFSGMMSAILAVVCAVFAVSFHETIVEALLAGKAGNIAHGSLLMLLFAFSYIILRTIFDVAIPGNVRLPHWVDKIGGALFGLIAGAYAMGIVAIALQELPFGPSILGYSRYPLKEDRIVAVPQANHRRSTSLYIYDELATDEPGQFIDSDSTPGSLYFDQLVLNTVNYFSNGGTLAGGQTFSSVHPELLQELFGQRIGMELGAKRLAMNTGSAKTKEISVLGVYIPPAGSLRAPVDAEIQGFRTLKLKRIMNPGSQSVALVVRLSVNHSATDKDQLFRFSPGSVRLVVPAGDNGAAVNYYPIGTVSAAQSVFANKLDDLLFVDIRTGDSAVVDLLFLPNKNGLLDGKKLSDGCFIEVKRLGRVDLSGMSVQTDNYVASPDEHLLRPVLVYTPPAVAVPPVAAPTPPPPPPAPAAPPSPTPDNTAPSTPTPAPTPAQNIPSLHSPQAAVQTAANAILQIESVTAASSLPIAIACGDDSGKLQTPLPGGTCIIKNGKFQSLNLDPQETQDKLSSGSRPIKDLLAKDGEGLVIVAATDPTGSWDWVTKADQLNIVGTDGKGYPANGMWADIDAGGAKKFYARYSTDYSLNAGDPGTGKPTNVWICFSVPTGTQVNQLTLGSAPMANFEPVHVAGQ